MGKLKGFLNYVVLSAFFTTAKGLYTPTELFKVEDFDRINILVIVMASTLPIIGPLTVKCFRQDLGFFRLFSLWSYFSMVILIGLIIATAVFNLYENQSYFFTINVTAAVLISFYYLYSLLEAQCCREKKFLENLYSCDEIDRCLNTIYQSKPLILFRINCYHYEVSSVGDTAYRETVTSHRESVEFVFKSCRDVSDRSQVPFAQKAVTRIKLSKVLSFSDEQTSKKFLETQSDLIERNKNKDQYYNIELIIDIRWFEKRLISLNTVRPFWMNKFYFQLAHFLTLSWPYRWLLNRNFQHVNHSIIKEISIFENQHLSSSVLVEANSSNQVFQYEQSRLQTVATVCSTV